MHRFLSADWVDAVRKVRDEYVPQVEAQAAHSGDDVAVNLLITNLPDGADDVRAHAAVRATGSDLDLGHVDDASVLVTVDYVTARRAVVDQDVAAMVKGFLLGKIVITGDLTTLLGPDGADPAALLAAFDLSGTTSIGELDPTAGEIADRIRALTC
jgi:hypothetical protein